MKNFIVRLQSLSIENLQNVSHGSIRFACNLRENIFDKGADILGIYGQNGSGKTTIIHAINILQQILTGHKLDIDEINYITFGKIESKLSFEFSVIDHKDKFKLVYEFVIKKIKEESLDVDNLSNSRVVVARETVKVAEFKNEKWQRTNTVIDVDFAKEAPILAPQKTLSILANNNKSLNDLQARKALALMQGSSFVFSKQFQDILKTLKNTSEVAKLLIIMHIYGSHNLYVIGTRGWGPINLNLVLPFYLKVKYGTNKLIMGNIGVNLNQSTLLPKDAFFAVEKAVKILDKVLKHIIPGLNIEVQNMGKDILADGAEGIRISLFSVRDKIRIPLKYESEGIKKIVAILQMLIVTFNDESMTLAVDELDAGIFEYLLGELLSVFAESGKGQLIFTSHNLRPLETLKKASVVFTTTNRENRYTRLVNIKTNNNLRDCYYHDIVLGGQNEELYDRTNNFEIAYALKTAGDKDD